MGFEPTNTNKITRSTFNFFDFIKEVVDEMRADTAALSAIADQNGTAISARTGAPFYEYGNILDIKNKIRDDSKVNPFAENQFPLIIIKINKMNKLYQKLLPHYFSMKLRLYR